MLSSHTSSAGITQISALGTMAFALLALNGGVTSSVSFFPYKESVRCCCHCRNSFYIFWLLLFSNLSFHSMFLAFAPPVRIFYLFSTGTLFLFFLCSPSYNDGAAYSYAQVYVALFCQSILFFFSSVGLRGVLDRCGNSHYKRRRKQLR